MKTKITAIAPTGYQLKSLTHFGMGYKKNMNGSFYAEKEFDSEEEAKEYLRQRADIYNNDDPCGSEDRLNDMYNDVERGCLTLDAVTASIDEFEK